VTRSGDLFSLSARDVETMCTALAAAQRPTGRLRVAVI
jgi:hypothetical protein